VRYPDTHVTYRDHLGGFVGSGNRHLLVALSAALIATSACGTRLPDEAFRQGEVVLETEEAGESGRSGPANGSDTGTDAGPTGAGPAAADPGSGDAPTAPGAEGDSAGPADPGAGPGGPAASGPNQASDVGVTETTIKVGTIVAENGVLGDAFAPVARGIRAWVGHINASGGINGRKVELSSCDDREDRSRALSCARRLVEQDQVFAIVATNTRALGGAAPYLAEKKIPVFGVPITNAFYRWPNFFSAYGAPYKRDGQEVGHQDQLRSQSGAYRWFKQNLGVTKAAVVAYDISESAQAGKFMAEGLELEGFQVDLYTVSFAAPSFDQVVADMQRKKTEIVFDAMDDGANRRFCDTLARRGYQVKAKVSTIVAMGQSLGNDFNETCRNVTFIGGSSIPYTQTKVPGVAAFRQAFDRYQPGQELHQWALEAYELGNMFAEGVSTMGPAPTRTGLIAHFNGLKGERVVDGVLLQEGYQPADFGAERQKDCFTISRWLDDKDGWVQATDQFPFCYPDAFQYFTPVAERGD
jgi:branched-chain amino acid transport system substrate-binding protein